MTRLFSLLFTALLLAGCATQPNPLYSKAVVLYKLTEDLPEGVHGRTSCSGGEGNRLCEVKIRESTYPACYNHERRHVFEDNWHEGFETTWDCDDK